MNKVILAGRLTRDLELKYTPNGVAVATGTLAVNRRYKQEGQPEADFINIVIWQKPAENAANMIGKGCRVEIVGRWNTRNYDDQNNPGKKVYVNECVVEEITFVDFRDANGNPSNGQNQQQNNQGSQSQGQQQQNRGGGQYGGQGGQQYRSNNDPFAGNNGQIDISDDDLPF
jgi:single-strand DNA-binding protein